MSNYSSLKRKKPAPLPTNVITEIMATQFGRVAFLKRNGGVDYYLIKKN
tara:strand:- start:40 stop:186 length:147 start_codon:yes stop_codon:yes gene_type:complete